MNWLPKRLARGLKSAWVKHWERASQKWRFALESPKSAFELAEVNLEASYRAIDTQSESYTGDAGSAGKYTASYASIVFPVYNEQTCIDRTFNAVLKYAKAHSTYQFIFVDDGSTDQTAAQLEARIAASECDRLILISYKERSGKGHAVRRGMRVADGKYVCFIDGDLAYSLEHIDMILAKLEYYNVVIGCRKLVPCNYQRLKPLRRLAGKIFNVLSRFILNLNYVDMQAGLKGFQRSAANRLFSLQELNGFSFDVELIYLAQKHQYSIAEIPAQVSFHHHRKRSKVNLLLDSIKMVRDLLRIRLNDWLGRYE